MSHETWNRFVAAVRRAATEGQRCRTGQCKHTKAKGGAQDYWKCQAVLAQ